MSAQQSQSVPQLLEQLKLLMRQAEHELDSNRKRVKDLRQQYQLLRQQGAELQQKVNKYSEQALSAKVIEEG
jgi:flagellar biosynthesis chaperone FliJ